MTAVAWLHDDALRHWYGAAPAVYVFDDEKLKRERWSLKRVGFIYECLLELPVEIRRGDVVAQVLSFQKSHAASTIVTLQTPDPRLQEQIAALQETTPVTVHDQEPFVALSGKVDLRRFSRYWTKAERALLAADTL